MLFGKGILSPELLFVCLIGWLVIGSRVENESAHSLVRMSFKRMRGGGEGPREKLSSD